MFTSHTETRDKYTIFLAYIIANMYKRRYDYSAGGFTDAEESLRKKRDLSKVSLQKYGEKTIFKSSFV